MPCRLDLSVQTVRGGCPPNSRRASGSYHARRDGKWGRVCVRAVIDGSMSALGQTETRALRRSMSVLPPGAEMCVTGRFAPQAADEKVKTVLTQWSSARYRATRKAGWRKNCHAYAAIRTPGMPRKFGSPDFARERFNSEIISSMIESLIYSSSRRGSHLDRVTDKQHLQGEHV